MKRFIALPFFVALISLVPTKVFAHCPLCVGGAGAAAALASVMGVKYGAIGVFMGGFAVALSLFIVNRLPKKFKYQNVVVGWLIYLTTLIPMYPFLKGDYVSWFISAGGDYGSLLNKTYLIDLFIVGSIIGSLIVLYSMKLSTRITEKRGGKQIKFQGMILTFSLLIISVMILQLWPR
ncbi:hypothetical protein B7Z00_04820 [Candidatus Saccharibacteria bacterium 32-50-10]|nr:MAG: hypothetical protein B7Z00_04820 [Candidatus Saccharibacteria bacterium 32-50-10]